MKGGANSPSWVGVRLLYSKAEQDSCSATSAGGRSGSSRGTSLVAQWIRLCAPNAGGPGSIPGQGTRSHMPQLRVGMSQLRSWRAATKETACRN